MLSISQSPLEGHWVVVLCGGRGSRLGSVTESIPKSLALIHDKPIIWYTFLSLFKDGFRKFVFPLGYRGSMIEEFISKEFYSLDCKIRFIDTGEDTPISQRLHKVSNQIADEDDFFLINGDTFFDFDIYGEKQCNKYQKFEKLTSLVKDIFKDEKDKEIWDVITKSMEEYNVNYILKYFEEKESLEENYLKKVRLSANDIVFDGGAYDGKDVLEFAGKVGDKGLVYAFDPRAKLEQQFKGNSFSNIVIVPKALCDKRAEMFFVDTGSTTVLCNDWHEGAISVESITIDGFVDENKINRLDFVKLDVEGSELDVLRGGERSIKKLKPKTSVFTHIEEIWNKNYDDYCKLEEKYKDLNIKFAFDGLTIKV